jgi:hypothetical protein
VERIITKTLPIGNLKECCEMIVYGPVQQWAVPVANKKPFHKLLFQNRCMTQIPRLSLYVPNLAAKKISYLSNLN